jgi:hypothetical protein
MSDYFTLCRLLRGRHVLSRSDPIVPLASNRFQEWRKDLVWRVALIFAFKWVSRCRGLGLEAFGSRFYCLPVIYLSCYPMFWVFEPSQCLVHLLLLLQKTSTP